MKRKPFVAGRFYSGSRQMLLEELESYSSKGKKKVKALGIVSPHAGYVYSGKVAGEVFSSVELPSKFIILSPNHTGMGERVSIWVQGQWETPLGSVSVDENLCRKIMEGHHNIKEDAQAHLMEHSLEVQIPFIQYFKKQFQIVPLTMAHISLEECKKLGKTIAEAIQSEKEDVLIIASSDMTHYENAKSAEAKDKLAIEMIKDLDPEGLYNTVRNNNISMCGVIPATCMIYAAKELGARKGTLVKYTNSGEVSGDYDQVVGYAGLYVS